MSLGTSLVSQFKSAQESQLHCSCGSGMLRAWHQTEGLILELPALGVLDLATGQTLAWFEEAAALEGKAPEGIQSIRPWWGESIVDADVLRAMLAAFRERVWQAWPAGQSTQLVSRTTWTVPSSTSDLHLTWLERTLGEAGWWWPKVGRAALESVTQQSGQVIVMDWGMSSIRWSVWSHGKHLLSVSNTNLGLGDITQELVMTERQLTGRQFSQASLLDLTWTLRHSAFDHKTDQPIFEPLSKTTHAAVQSAWLAAFAQAWTTFQKQLPSEVGSQLAVSSCVVIGGGALLQNWLTEVEKHTKLPWKVAKDPLYVEVRGGIISA